MAVSSVVGTRVKRKEDPRLLTGRASYVEDLVFPGMVWAAIVRSPYAHATLRHVDTAAAARHPGVLAVLTGADLKDKVGGIPVAHRIPDLKEPFHPPMATEEVHYVGEPVAAVVATDRYVAKDAVQLVNVDYEPLPVVVDPEKAMEPGSPLVHKDLGTNIAFSSTTTCGDIEQGFAEADLTVSARFVNQRLVPNAIEPRGVISLWHPGYETLTVYSSTQIPHLLKLLLSGILGVPEHKVRIVAPEVGGGFGSKLNCYSEEVIVGYLSQQLGRPVKWIEERSEAYLATIHGRDQINYVEVGVKKDGRITALKVQVIADLGAYHQLLTPVIPVLTGLMITGCYKVPNLKCDIHAVFTNKISTDAYRGAGRPEATYLIERAIDLVARKLRKDPIAVRRKNFPKSNEFPFTTPSGIQYDSGDYQRSLDRLLELIDYPKLREEQKALRKQGKLMGIGFSTYVEVCGMGPSAAMPAGGWESCTVRVERTGKVTVLTGISPHGQGEETTFAQIVADEFGIPIEDVEVIHGDTDRIQSGIGTFGSRGVSVGGAALFLATREIREKVKKLAAHLLEASPEDMVFEGGKLFVRGAPSKAVTFLDVVTAAYIADNLPEGVEPGLEAVHFFEPPNFTYPFGAHCAIVDIDRDTGEVTIRRYVAVDDCGKVINPMIVDGQLHGGIAQGIAQAMYEEAIYDENGQLLTASMLDYAVPKASYMPSFELDRTETPSPVNPLGVKGVGEAGTIASSAAVVNAVVDALAPFGVDHVDMPVKPERIWKLIHKGGK